MVVAYEPAWRIEGVNIVWEPSRLAVAERNGSSGTFVCCVCGQTSDGADDNWPTCCAQPMFMGRQLVLSRA
jgi:hypothetical protein